MSYSIEAAGTIDQVNDAVGAAKAVPDEVKTYIAEAIGMIRLDGDDLDVVGTHGVRVSAHGSVDDNSVHSTVEIRRVLCGGPKISVDEYNARCKAKADKLAAEQAKQLAAEKGAEPALAKP